jgi:hypothetical protein
MSENILVRVGDIDINLDDRRRILDVLPHVPATRFIENSRPERGSRRHDTGVYFQCVPLNASTASADFHHKSAPKGVFKVDFLNLHSLSGMQTAEMVRTFATQPPDWALLKERDVVQTLPEINRHYEVVQKFFPSRVEHLATLVAAIRPAFRKHLNTCSSIEELSRKIWTGEKSDGYSFKRSHAFAYATHIVMIMNQISAARSLRSARA